MKTTTIKFKRYIKNDPLQRKEIGFYHFGAKQWYLNGERHREDGPAVEYANGTKYWYLNGKQFFLQKEYWEALEKYKREKNIK